MSLIFIGCDNESQLVDVPSTSQVTPRAHLGAFAFVSSNTSGQLGIFAVGAAIANPPSVGLDQRFLNLAYADADGVVYDENRDAIYQVDRTNSRVVALDSISARTNGESVAPNAMGPSTFINGREATMYNNKVVVADDVTPGRLASYHVNTDHISDYRWHDVGFEVWGIQATAKDLWAIEDVSSNVVFFRDYFKAKSGALSATSIVAIEGLVRTHGLHYDESADLMVLTDIGAASSATDGALIVITNFAAKFAAAGNGGSPEMDRSVHFSPQAQQWRSIGAQRCCPRLAAWTMQDGCGWSSTQPRSGEKCRLSWRRASTVLEKPGVKRRITIGPIPNVMRSAWIDG
jgi:hypothetical protein